ncbi:MAG TPA: hypothetical protein VF240_01570, partial [Pyrinomonadaceae bacterium]
MSSRRRLSIAAGLPLVLAVFAVSVPAQQQKATSEPRPPIVSVEADPNVVTVCPDNGSMATTQVRLRARASSPDGNTLRYRPWTVGVGSIVGTGENVVWDLSGVLPGTYTARVEVESGPDGNPLCEAFATVPVVVRACPPPRPYCPNVSISCPDTVAVGQPVTFTATFSGGTPGVTPTYRWTVSEGSIISGQDTSSIQVGTVGLGGRAITAKVEVLGYNLDCSASCTAQVPELLQARSFDDFSNIPRDDEKARLDNFAIQLQNEPGAAGHVIIYPARAERPGTARRRADRIR